MEADRRQPQQRRSAEIVESILTATSYVITRFGLTGATIERISDTAGVSAGSIYQYFSSKRSLFGGFVERGLFSEQQLALASIKKFSHLPIKEFIPSFIGFMCAHFRENRETLRHVYTRSGEFGKHAEHMSMRQDVIDMLSEVFAQHRDELRIDDYDRAATLLVHSVMGALTAGFANEEFPYTIEEMKDEIITMTERYLIR